MTFQPGAVLNTQSFGNRPEGVEVPFIATYSPSSTDVNFPVGKRWINKTSNLTFELTSISTVGGTPSATWTPTGTSSGAINTLTTEDSTVVTPTAGNVNVTGSGTIQTTGSGSTVTISPTLGGFPITPYVVGPIGQAGYQTVQAAINAAHLAGGGAVYIQQGSYTENLTLFDQVNLVGVPAISQGTNQGVIINGTHTPPTAGHVLINGICLVSTTSVLSSLAAGTTHITLSNCESAVQNGYLVNLLNWTGIIEIYDCNPVASSAPWAINDGCINNTGGSPIIIYNSGGGSGTNVMTISGNNSIFGQAVTIGCPVNLVTGANLTSIGSQYNGTVTFSNNSIFSSYEDSFVTGSSPAITMSSSGAVLISNATIQSTNNPAITGAGAGTLSLGNINFVSNSSISGTLTVAWLPTKTGSFTATGTSSLVSGTNADTITIGGATQTGTITVGSSSGANTVVIAGGAGATTLQLANAQTGGSVAIGAAMTTGTIAIGGTGLQTGTITIGGGTGAQTLNFGTGGTGVKTIHIGDTASVANVISIGSLTGTLTSNCPTLITLASGAGTGLAVDTSGGTGVAATFKSTSATTDAIQILPSSGGIKVNPTVVTAGASPQTCNNRFGSVTFSGVSIASGGTQAFVINNTTVAATNTVIRVSWYGATQGSALSIQSITSVANTSFTVTMTNGTSATMVTSTANITFVFWVMN